VRYCYLTFFFSWGILSLAARAEVRLLTGDSNNEIHRQASTLIDLSPEGDLVLFRTMPAFSPNSTPGITEGGFHLRKLSANTLTFVGDNAVANPGAMEGGMSDNGRYLTWTSDNSNIYWRDVQSSVTRLITTNANGASRQPVISADGRYVAFLSVARNLIGDASKLPAANRAGVYVYDSQTQTTTIGSLAPGNVALNTGVGSATTPINSFDFSSNGQFIVYSTEASNAHADRSAVNPAFFCVCRRNLATGEVVLLNRDAAGAVANGNFTGPRINAAGNRTLFTGGFIGLFDTKKMISSAPANTGFDVYVKDSGSGAVWLATKTTDNSAHEGALGTAFSISDDGAVVSFGSSSTKLVSENTEAGGGHDGSMDLFRADLATGGTVTTTLVTKSPTNTGNVDYRVGPILAGNGSYIAFCTDQLTPMLGGANPYAANFQGVGTGTLPAVVNTAQTFDAWAQALPSGQRGYDDNPAGDGVNNLTKYFMGMDGLTIDRRHLPVLARRTGVELGMAGDTATYLTLLVRIRRELPAGYNWTVRAANTLAELTSSPLTAVQVGTTTADGAFDIRLYRFPMPVGGAVTGFMDVKMTVP
jgi:hypothetical protein